jgi:hypothetical protein
MTADELIAVIDHQAARFAFINNVVQEQTLATAQMLQKVFEAFEGHPEVQARVRAAIDDWNAGIVALIAVVEELDAAFDLQQATVVGGVQ